MFSRKLHEPVVLAVLIGVLGGWSKAPAQGTYSLQPPVVGSANTADADPPVIRPTTKPCKVQLFSDYQFTGYATQTFSYVPPPSCTGPWSKVVFVGDFSVNGTNQYDRTAEIQLNDVMIYYGTTPEPTPTVQPSWHVESDLTDYSALFRNAQQGTVELGNAITVDDNGVQTGSAYLEFYPADRDNQAPKTADQILALPDLQQSPGAQKLSTGTSAISQVFALPANVEAVYLDIFTQGQEDDEIWWIANPPFRETLVSLDGKVAGLAPVYPYTYTGTLNPALWRPIPGVQTLNLRPYRVDLTPFAGILDDGQPHTIALGVYNAHDYFNAAATLLVFQDHGAQDTSGELLINSLNGVTAPTVTRTTVNGNTNVETSYAQHYQITGYVNTSHGRIDTDVESSLSFSNANVVSGTSGQINQITKATEKSTTRTGTLETAEEDILTFPFVFSTTGRTLSFDQKLTEAKKLTVSGFPVYESHLLDDVATTANVSAGASSIEPVANSRQTYHFTDTAGRCWSREISSNEGAVAAVKDGRNCPGDVNHWRD